MARLVHSVGNADLSIAFPVIMTQSLIPCIPARSCPFPDSVGIRQSDCIFSYFLFPNHMSYYFRHSLFRAAVHNIDAYSLFPIPYSIDMYVYLHFLDMTVSPSASFDVARAGTTF